MYAVGVELNGPGLEGFRLDIEIPLKYGIDQCVGDTLAPGGIMYAQRGIPAVLDFCRDIKEVAKPDCLFLSYGNPNAMLTWAANEFGCVDTIGLCHGVEGGWHQIANVLGAKDHREVDIVCAGINHQTWYVQVIYKGRKVTGEELLRAFERHPVYPKTEKVRIDMLRRFGYYTTESNGHVSEYVPWYRKRRRRSGSGLISRAGSTARRAGTCAAASRGGTGSGRISPTGSRPRTRRSPLKGGGTSASVNVQRMAVHAAVKGDVMLLKQAMLHDPLRAAVCDPEEVWQMTDEMLVAQAKWLPQYRREIPKARERLRHRKVKTRKWEGEATGLLRRSSRSRATQRATSQSSIGCEGRAENGFENGQDNCLPAGRLSLTPHSPSAIYPGRFGERRL